MIKKLAGFLLTAALLGALVPALPAAADGTHAVAERDVIEMSKAVPITVGVIDNSAPICYRNDETDTYEGIAVSIMNAVAEGTGLCIEYVPVDLSRSDAATIPNEDSPEIVLGVTYSETLPDERGWIISDSIYSDLLAVVGRRGADLSRYRPGKTVAIMSDFIMVSKYVEINMPEYAVIKYETIGECLDAVAEGKADTAVYMRSCINYLLQRPYYDRLEILPGYNETIDICVAGFTEDSRMLISIINKGLQKVSADESLGIMLNYTVMNPYRLTVGDILYKYRVSLLIISVLALLVIGSMSAMVITSRKSAKKVKSALVVAEHASAAKGNFMSRMSHEIRTPLNAVIGYNTIALNELSDAETDADYKRAEQRVADCLTKSDIASKHLLSIINDVLDVSAIESDKIKIVNERLDFKGLISSLTAIFYSQAKSKGVNFHVHFDSQPDEWLLGDQMRLSQVLTNLLSNAVKFTPEGGDVTLTIHPQNREGVTDIRFMVKDTGIGMSDEQMNRIWRPFEQADSSITRRFGGTGLGLSITKALVNLMGGTISIESEPGSGSVFTVDLSFGRVPQPKERSCCDFSKINALIVDDDVSTCNYIRLLLTRGGIRSSFATSGAAAVSAVDSAIEAKDPYTLCLVDWQMPGMDGIETARRIREIAGDELPIIVITAYDFSEIADRASEVGINMFVAKPLFQSSLFDTLANTLGSPAPAESSFASPYDFSGARLLLAEDNAMNMEIASQILKRAGFDVDCAWNGEEAALKFENSPVGSYDAILMDVQMPVMDGYRATRRIRESDHPEAKTIPIIAMTADAFAENIAESLACGMNDHISKPIDIAELFDKLEQHIARRSRGANS